MKWSFHRSTLSGVLRWMSVTYAATLPAGDQTVLFVSCLLRAERQRRGTRKDTRALSPFKQAVLILRWFLDATRVAQSRIDNAIGKSTIYDYLDEGFTVLAARAPKLESALLAAKMAGHSHISIDGTLTGSAPSSPPPSSSSTPTTTAPHDHPH